MNWSIGGPVSIDGQDFGRCILLVRTTQGHPRGLGRVIHAGSVRYDEDGLDRWHRRYWDFLFDEQGRVARIIEAAA